MAKAKFDTSFSFGANAGKPRRPKTPKRTQTATTRQQYAQARRRGGQLHEQGYAGS